MEREYSMNQELLEYFKGKVEEGKHDIQCTEGEVYEVGNGDTMVDVLLEYNDEVTLNCVLNDSINEFYNLI